jgi:hypothetical protein
LRRFRSSQFELAGNAIALPPTQRDPQIALVPDRRAREASFC